MFSLHSAYLFIEMVIILSCVRVEQIILFMCANDKTDVNISFYLLRV